MLERGWAKRGKTLSPAGQVVNGLLIGQHGG